MNAIDLAKCLDAETVKTVRLDILHNDAAEMLRRQHEAIVKLREALAEMKAHATQIENKVGYLSAKRKQEVGQIYNLAAQALKDTEDLK